VAGLHEEGHEPDGIELQVEPGRAIYGNAGIHLARIMHVKSQHEPIPRTWYETDTSEAFLADTIIEANSWTILFADQGERPETAHAAVTGASCGFDLIVAAQTLPRVPVGEILAILDTGAYQDSAANNVNAMARPASVLVSRDRAVLVRRRETLAEITARDVPPDAVLAEIGSTHPLTTQVRR
jgi:diaminopimelate decarboxylase